MKLRRIHSPYKIRFDCEGCKKSCFQALLWRAGFDINSAFLCSEACAVLIEVKT